MNERCVDVSEHSDTNATVGYGGYEVRVDNYLAMHGMGTQRNLPMAQPMVAHTIEERYRAGHTVKECAHALMLE